MTAIHVNKFSTLTPDESAELVKRIRELLFVAESVAHLKGLEREILPSCDKVREFISAM